jgi:hypothetical protein
VVRSAKNVANYFWVDNEITQGLGGVVMQAALAKNGDGYSILTYPNSAANLYGFRLMSVNTEQYKAEAVLQQRTQTLLDFMDGKRAQLIAQNQDNVVFEAGAMTIRGREDIHAGEYVSLKLGTNGGASAGFEQQVYAHTVTHEFQPYRAFTTTIQFDRGTGFINRIQREARVVRTRCTSRRCLRGVSTRNQKETRRHEHHPTFIRQRHRRPEQSRGGRWRR